MREKRRYVLIRMEPGLQRTELLSLLAREGFPDLPAEEQRKKVKLIESGETYAVMRVRASEKDAFISSLRRSRLPVRVVTVSGTLKTLRSRVGLERPRRGPVRP